MVVSILLAWRGAGPWAIILGNLASQFAATAQLLAASRRPHLRLHDPHIASLLRLGFLSGAQTTLGTITTRGFIIAFGAAYGAHAVGLLNFALRLVEESCGVILNTLRRVTVTSFAAARRRGLDIRPLFMRGTAMIAYVAAPLFLGLAAVAQEAVPFLFGAKWAAAVPAFQLLLILWVVRACRMLVNAIMLVEGEQRQMVMLGLFGVAATALAFTLLLPFGPDWAIYAYSGTLLGVILGGGLFRRFTGITIAQQLLAPLRPILFALIMCAVVALARQALPADWPLMMRLALLIGAGGVAFTSLAFILDRRSLQDLAKIARRQ
jgi:O-antigen/teichoic acid export membrane protein